MAAVQIRLMVLEETAEASKLLGAPGAIAATKRSFLGANGLTLDARAMALLAHESWMQRNSAEGREGTAAFRARRKPAWYPGA